MNADATTIHDFAGIGIGPFNLGLACLTRPIPELQGLFLDQRPDFDWHPGLMLPGTTLQTPFLADLVSLADPTHPLSFLNYLKRHQRLYPFYIREDFFVLRREYNQYCQWAARQCPQLRFGHALQSVSHEAARGLYRLQGMARKPGSATATAFDFLARRLVLGIGSEPWLPACCRPWAGHLTHSADYLSHKAALQRRSHITIVGGGQSAAEIFHDLLQEQPAHGYRLTWLTRSPRFVPLEYTRLTLEMTSPDYIDYFHALPETTRDHLLAGQSHLYKAINASLINAIYKLMYQHSVEGLSAPCLLTGTELRECRHDPATKGFHLQLWQRESGQGFALETEGLVLATGYRPRHADFLAPIEDRIARDSQGRYQVARNYSIDHQGSEIFVQNAALHSHGLASPDLGMACHHNTCIIEAMLGRPWYPIEPRIAYQTFGPLVPADHGIPAGPPA